MKRLLIVLLVSLVLLPLTGCYLDSDLDLDYEEYMREYVKINDIELELEIIYFHREVINGTIYGVVTYCEYFEKYTFKTITLFVECDSTKYMCKEITQIEYYNRRN